ncbi:hypothetical protein HYX08_06340 [Candidatus Woesearchaeota archaeon]|nr:hypothetical protein [Candidatus Woesearchaeota archaeon]
MAEDSDLIRIKRPTKELLEQLKIVESESFDAVITRVLQTKFEDGLSLNSSTKALLDKRWNNLQQGNVFPSNQLLARIKQKRQQKK